MNEEIECKTHPDAPHGFVRNASHTEDRYVCECEYWEEVPSNWKEPEVNKQIKNLMSKTLDEKFAGTWSTMDMQDLAKFSERFAELIVRECADLFVDQKYMILNPHEPFAIERVRALKQHDKDTVIKIRQHFGVEE